MELGDAVTLAGATILITILVEAIKRAMSWTEATTARFAPLLSILLGIIVVIALTAAQGNLNDNTIQLLAGAAITGVLSGAAASGLYDTTKSITGG